MELTLTVQPPSAPAIDVDFNVDANRPVKDVVDALVKATGVPATLSGDMSIYVPLRDAWLNNEMSVAQARLRVGEVVVLGRNTSESSVVIGDVVEKSKSMKQKKSSVGTSSYELCVVSGFENGKRFSLPPKSLLIVDRQGNVRVSDANLLMKKSQEPGDIHNDSSPQFEIEGVTQLDAASCLIECDSRIFFTPVTGNTSVEVRKVTARTELDEHAMIVCGGVQFFVRKKVVDEPLSVSERGIVGINRPPRDMQPPMERIINIEAPPRDPQKARISPIMIVAPALFGIVMVVVLKNVLYLAFAFMSPIMMIAQAADSKRSGKKEYKQGKAKFVADLENAVQQLRIGRREELAVRRIVFPDAADCTSRVLDGRHDLWDRRREDVDFLALRIGVGDQAALVSATIESGGSEDLREYGEKKLRRKDPIHLAPLAIPLPQFGALGLVGERESTKDVLSWLMLQVMTLQSHRDVSICAALPVEMTNEFEFLKWVPHVRHGGAEIDDPTVAFGVERSVVLFQKLRGLIDARLSSGTQGLQQTFTQWPSVVVFIDETVVRERTLIDGILKQGPSAGVFVVFLASQFRDLPGECRAVVEVNNTEQSQSGISVSYPGSGQAPIMCAREAVSIEMMNDVSQMLAPMRDVTASVSSGGGGSLPKGVRLLDILELTNPTPDDVMRRWANPPESLTATIGVTTDGVMKIDMRTDGPHALVAGTTGSGKSELLQTLVASIASNYSPEKVNFLFVDYKGGSAFADCATIPHSVGMVTDLDEYLAQRVLISLNAELKRRESLLREFGVKDLIVFEKRFPKECPPSLMIVIDEFAALVREVPDFVEGVVDIAQRGRSLGLHLILATQRPAGVINDNIRANTNLRIALRIADSGDSNDVIGTDEAARISRTIPGRAFVRMGPSELRGFQTGYGGDFTVTSGTGEGVTSEEEAASRPINIEPFNLLNLIEITQEDDLEALVGEEEDDEPDESALTDLRYLCDVISETARFMKLPKPKRPWLEPLASVIPLHAIGDMQLLDQNDPGRRVILGVVDLPQIQEQHTYVHDFENDGNMFIYGSSNSGKTTTLRAIAGSIAVASSPKDAVIYAIDCASGGLECLKQLPHTAAVISTREAEGMAIFLSRMNQEVESRKELFRREGVASLGEFRTRLKNNGVELSVPLPRIVILIDSFAGYQAAFEKIEYGAWVDAIQRMLSDGRPLGIHLIVTADRRGAIPFNMAGLVEEKLIMKMADPDELSSLGVAHKVAKEIKLPPGRALLKGEIEIQIPTVSAKPDGASQVQQIGVIGKYLTELYGDTSSHKVASLPDSVSIADLAVAQNQYQATLAVAAGSQGLITVTTDLNAGHLMVIGPRGIGKSTALATVAKGLVNSGTDVPIYVFTPRPSLVSAVEGVRAAAGFGACEEQITELLKTVEEAPDGEVPRMILIVDDSADLMEGKFASAIEYIIKYGRESVKVVAAGESSIFSRSYSGWLAEIKKYKHGLLFKPDFQLDGDLVGVNMKPLPGQVFPPGRAYYCKDGISTLVQVAQ